MLLQSKEISKSIEQINEVLESLLKCEGDDKQKEKTTSIKCKSQLRDIQ